VSARARTHDNRDDDVDNVDDAADDAAVAAASSKDGSGVTLMVNWNVCAILLRFCVLCESNKQVIW